MGLWMFGIPLVLVSTLGLLLNAYVLLVVLGLGKQTQQQQTSNTLLLIHLGAVEFALCFILLITTTGPWTINGTWCILHGFLLTLLHPVALWTVTGLNCDRYYAIAAPLHYTAVVSPRRVILGLIASWSGALLLCLPALSGFIAPFKYNHNLGCCIPDFGHDLAVFANVIYAIIYVFLGLILPAVLVTICNLRVLGIARYHRHRIASAIYEVTLSAQVTITHQRNPFFVPSVTAPSAGGPPRFHSAASTVMQLVGSLYLLYFPYCGLILWEACSAASQSRFHVHPQLMSLASLLLASSPPINGLLYGLKSRTLRRSVQNYWRKKVTKSELQQEIQARTPSVAGSRRPSGSGPVSLFPFPPIQRRLSEALLNLGANPRCGSVFDSSNIGNFHRGRLQPAASCNTLRVPTSESGESGRLVRTSASTASLMGYRESSNTTIEPSHVLTSNNSKRSPRILITRAYSVESPDGGSPLLKRSVITSGNFTTTNDKKRWRHISTGSDSSTGSSDASVWTTGIAPKIARGNLKNSMDNWPIGKRFTRVKTLEEGALLFSGLRSNNSESSDTTDTTATTATSTLPSKTISMCEDVGRKDEKPIKEKAGKNIGERSESEPSWSSVDEENEKNEKNAAEDEPEKKDDDDDNEEKEEERKEEKMENHIIVEKNKERNGDGSINDDSHNNSCNSSSTEDETILEIDANPKVAKKYRKRRKEKTRTSNSRIIRENEKQKLNDADNKDNTLQLRPLLITPS